MKKKKPKKKPKVTTSGYIYPRNNILQPTTGLRWDNRFKVTQKLVNGVIGESTMVLQQWWESSIDGWGQEGEWRDVQVIETNEETKT